ncbi:AAA domain-containing protein [Favolaschia claudopus]|uniref:AAA domain-containing protein n=1 Tax=Favolaschia claudopus TaxID=2862362 RepID=A0AAW0DW49_9AGAR
MPGTRSGPSASSSSVLHHASITATSLKHLAESTSMPCLQAVAAVTLMIVKTAESVRVNKQQWVTLVEQIHHLLCVIIELFIDDSKTVAPMLLDSIARFLGTLQRIESFMRIQRDMSRFRRFLRHQEDTLQLAICKQELRQALDVFSAEARGAAISHVVSSTVNSDNQHQELLKLVAENPDERRRLCSDSMSLGSSISLRSSYSVVSLLLPGAPQVFHGRESELRDIVHGLMHSAARLAILGPGGIGKTTLTKAALHDPQVVAKYSARYFVCCDSAQTVENLAAVVASGLGLQPSGQMSEDIVQYLSAQTSCLVVLDNFETPWEPAEHRSKVEDFLAVLGSFPHVSLLVTMRGQERPLKTRWTRPFLPALAPLSSEAAHRTFMDIADTDGDDEAPLVSDLLVLAGNLPLAVTLLASIAQLDGCDSVLARWKTESVSLLSDGFDKATNLETSLRLSLSSPRITSSPGALQLLSVLALLPDGILDTDLRLASCPISDILHCKSTLIRTSLAYIEGEKLKVLAPVRELIRQIHPPSYTLVAPLRTHWATLIELWRTYQMPSGDLVQRLAGVASNIHSLLKYTLELGDVPDLIEIVYGVFYWDAFISRTYGETSPLMANILAHIERVDNNALRGCYIWHRFQHSEVAAADAVDLIAQGTRFFQLAGDLAGQCRLQYAVTLYYIRQGDLTKASMHASLAYSLADQANDDIRRNRALCTISSCEHKRGRFRQALISARRAQRLANRIQNFQHETKAMEGEAQVWVALGDFPRAADIRGRMLKSVVTEGLQRTQFEIRLLDLEAEMYSHKTAYTEARKTYGLILQDSSLTRFPLFHGRSGVMIAAIDVILGSLQSKDEVVAALEIPRQIFISRGYLRGLPICDKVLADFLIGSGRMTDAIQLYENCARSFWDDSAEQLLLCMNKLGDITLRQSAQPEDSRSARHWATTYLAYGKQTASMCVIAWAFRCLGDLALASENDDATAQSLFLVALEEFTRMDIYRGKAECLLRLGSIARKQGGEALAQEYLVEAKQMFLNSGMVGEASRIL